MDRKDIEVRKRSLHDEDNPLLDHASLTMAERIALAWDLSLLAWQIENGSDGEPQFSKDSVRVVRQR